MTEPAIKIQDAKKQFGSHQVLCGISLTINSGESFALIGGSGMGKSVAMKCIIGLIKLDFGEIYLNGRNIREKDNIPYERIGMLFQESALFDSMTVWQNVAFRLLRGKNKLSPEVAKSVAIEKLERVGLNASAAELFPSELSGGMKKRVGLARAIATNPEFLFFDEPTTGLDPIRAAMINRMISGIVQDSNATAITITHDMESARIVADRAALLNNGSIVWQGETGEFENSDNPFLHQFVNGLSDGPMSLSV